MTVAGRRALQAIFVLSLVALSLDTWEAINRRYVRFDVPLTIWTQGIDWGPLRPLLWAIDWLTGPTQVVFALVLTALVFMVRREGTPLMIAGLLSGLVYGLTNRLIHRPRPMLPQIRVLSHPGEFSYPSGHVVFFMVTGMAMTLILTQPRSVVRRVAIGLVALLTVVVMASRVWEGVHWPSDVAGGLFLGSVWLSGLLLVPRLQRVAFPEPPGRTDLAAD